MDTARFVMNLGIGKMCIVAVGNMTKSCAPPMVLTAQAHAHGRFMLKMV